MLAINCFPFSHWIYNTAHTYRGDIDHSAHARDSSILHEWFVCGPDANKMPYKFRHVIVSHRKCLRILLLPHTHNKGEERKQKEGGRGGVVERKMCLHTNTAKFTYQMGNCWLYDEFIIEIYETGCSFLVSPNMSAICWCWPLLKMHHVVKFVECSLCLVRKSWFAISLNAWGTTIRC